MVMVDIDRNAILAEPLNSRNDAEVTRAYQTMMLQLNQESIERRKHILDNQVLGSTKKIICDEYQMKMELVPPGCHVTNASEVVIRNFKPHFLSALAGTANGFSTLMWDLLIEQIDITVNLVRQSNAAPNVSAYS